MNYELENSCLKVSLKSLGAELSSVINKLNAKEYLWQGLPEYWNGQAPVLFPFVGRLSNDEYRVKGCKYSLPQHGFARRQEFILINKTDSYAEFLLDANEALKKVYPFDFNLKISYKLQGSCVIVEYVVNNADTSDMFFSIGAHPGFNCPINNKLQFEDYYLQFNKPEKADAWKLSGPLFSGERVPFLDDEDKINLRYELFDEDALVFNKLQSDEITLKTDKSPEFVSMRFEGFPDLGIWTKPNAEAPYVCIEPWFGRADTAGFDGDISEKYGIIKLSANEEFKCKYIITIG